MHGGADDLAGADVEGAVVEVALDDVAVDFAFRQSPGPVRAGVVDDVIAIAELEDGDDEVADGRPAGLAPSGTSDVGQSDNQVAHSL